MNRYNAQLFRRKRDMSGVLVFSADASDLGLPAGRSPFDSMGIVGNTKGCSLYNPDTSRSVDFFESDSENYDGEAWVANPPAFDQAKFGLMRLVIFND